MSAFDLPSKRTPEQQTEQRQELKLLEAGEYLKEKAQFLFYADVCASEVISFFHQKLLEPDSIGTRAQVIDVLKSFLEQGHFNIDKSQLHDLLQLQRLLFTLDYDEVGTLLYTAVEKKTSNTIYFSIQASIELFMAAMGGKKETYIQKAVTAVFEDKRPQQSLTQAVERCAQLRLPQLATEFLYEVRQQMSSHPDVQLIQDRKDYYFSICRMLAVSGYGLAARQAYKIIQPDAQQTAQVTLSSQTRPLNPMIESPPPDTVQEAVPHAEMQQFATSLINARTIGDAAKFIDEYNIQADANMTSQLLATHHYNSADPNSKEYLDDDHRKKYVKKSLDNLKKSVSDPTVFSSDNRKVETIACCLASHQIHDLEMYLPKNMTDELLFVLITTGAAVRGQHSEYFTKKLLDITSVQVVADYFVQVVQSEDAVVIERFKAYSKEKPTELRQFWNLVIKQLLQLSHEDYVGLTQRVQALLALCDLSTQQYALSQLLVQSEGTDLETLVLSMLRPHSVVGQIVDTTVRSFSDIATDAVSGCIIIEKNLYVQNSYRQSTQQTEQSMLQAMQSESGEAWLADPGRWLERASVRVLCAEANWQDMSSKLPDENTTYLERARSHQFQLDPLKDALFARTTAKLGHLTELTPHILSQLLTQKDAATQQYYFSYIMPQLLRYGHEADLQAHITEVLKTDAAPTDPETPALQLTNVIEQVVAANKLTLLLPHLSAIKEDQPEILLELVTPLQEYPQMSTALKDLAQSENWRKILEVDLDMQVAVITCIQKAPEDETELFQSLTTKCLTLPTEQKESNGYENFLAAQHTCGLAVTIENPDVRKRVAQIGLTQLGNNHFLQLISHDKLTIDEAVYFGTEAAKNTAFAKLKQFLKKPDKYFNDFSTLTEWLDTKPDKSLSAEQVTQLIPALTTTAPDLDSAYQKLRVAVSKCIELPDTLTFVGANYYQMLLNSHFKQLLPQHLQEYIQAQGNRIGYLYKNWLQNSPLRTSWTLQNITVLAELDALSTESAQSPSKQLTTNFGIKNFARYPIEVMHKQLELKPGTKVVMIVNPASDHNGSFTQNYQHYLSLHQQAQAHDHAVVVVEADSAVSFSMRLEHLQKRMGLQIKGVIVAAHGSKEHYELNGIKLDTLGWEFVLSKKKNGTVSALTIQNLAEMYHSNPSILAEIIKELESKKTRRATKSTATPLSPQQNDEPLEDYRTRLHRAVTDRFAVRAGETMTRIEGLVKQVLTKSSGETKKWYRRRVQKSVIEFILTARAVSALQTGTPISAWMCHSGVADGFAQAASRFTVGRATGSNTATSTKEVKLLFTPGNVLHTIATRPSTGEFSAYENGRRSEQIQSQLLDIWSGKDM